ncbi:MAG: 2OG-Fe(II) oxygenase [Chitinophagales bacterium]
MFSNTSFTIEKQLQFNAATPYKHIVLDRFLDDSVANEVYNNFPDVDTEGWIHYLHFNENKHGLNKRDLIPEPILKVIDYLNSPEFVSQLSLFTGIPNLIPDSSLEGGGIHQTKRGGKLNIHADFTAHPHHSTWRRRLNVLIYFNKDWKPEYNGYLELWSTDLKICTHKISPDFNRCVMFATAKDSFHGVPDELLCPENNSRKSLALYYYTIEEKVTEKASTNYQPRPTDGWVKRLLIIADKKMVAVYTAIKGKFGINDDFVSRLLSFFSKRK